MPVTVKGVRDENFSSKPHLARTKRADFPWITPVKSNSFKLVAITLLALGLVVFFLPKRSVSKPSASSVRQREATAVRTIIVKTESMSETIVATGTTRAEESVDIQPEISGKLLRISFQEGSTVKSGELLAVISDAELRASLQRALYRRELAELKANRLATLRNQGGVTEQEYDIALSERNVFNAEVALIEAQLAHTEIRAPFDGVVGLRFVSNGAFVTPATQIVTFQRLDQLKVDFAVPEKYAERIKLESPVNIRIAGGSELVGKVYAIDPRIDPTTRTILIRALCPNPARRVMAGAFVHVRLTLEQISNAILVPSFALIPGVTERSIFVVADGKAERRVVITGIRTTAAVQITEGLKPGEMVVTSGLQQLKSGQSVRVVPIDSPMAKPQNEAFAGHQPERKPGVTALN